MFKRTITLFTALSLILALALTVDAHIDTPLARSNHGSIVHRIVKKRSAGAPEKRQNLVDSIFGKNSVNNNANSSPPNAITSPGPNPKAPGTGSEPNDDPPSPSGSGSVSSASATSSSPVTSPSPTQGGIVKPILGPIVGGQSTASPASISSTLSSSSTSSSTSSSSSSSPSSSSTSITPTLPPPTPLASASRDVAAPANSQPVGVVTITTPASPSPTSDSDNNNSGSVSKTSRTTIIILVAVGASIGVAGLIWTVIRKWKFRPSKDFEGRMQPIDWQPTTHDDHDITEKLARNGSTRSHGSFTSANNHDTLAADLPPHDFTAGPAHLAPVGGYADLQRGPSPQPDYRSTTPYQYDIPNPHGPYYNTGGGAYSNAPGAYQGGYEQRGY